MPISSFYGMQTSLRGLMAQQRMIDTTGHNIANASTVGYSRQEATLAASQALQLQVSGSQSRPAPSSAPASTSRASAASATSSWTCSSAGQNTSLNDWKAQAEALDSAELALAEPGDTGINAQLAKFWNAWSDLSKSPDSEAAKQALVQRPARSPTRSTPCARRWSPRRRRAQGQYDSIAGPGGEVEKIAAELAGLNKTISEVPAQRRLSRTT